MLFSTDDNTVLCTFLKLLHGHWLISIDKIDHEKQGRVDKTNWKVIYLGTQKNESVVPKNICIFTDWKSSHPTQQVKQHVWGNIVQSQSFSDPLFCSWSDKKTCKVCTLPVYFHSSNRNNNVIWINSKQTVCLKCFHRCPYRRQNCRHFILRFWWGRSGTL